MSVNEIRNEILGQLGESKRDRRAKRLVMDNLKIEKIGAWYFVTLFDETIKLHVNKKYIGNECHSLILFSDVRGIAGDQIKKEYREEAATC